MSDALSRRDVLNTLAIKKPLRILIVLHADSVELRYYGCADDTSLMNDMLNDIHQKDPDARWIVYTRDDDPRLLMQGDVPDHFGAGWYALCEPERTPRLVRMDAAMPMHPLRVFTGVDLDTGQRVEQLAILHVLGPHFADAEPFLEHPERRSLDVVGNYNRAPMTWYTV